MHLSVSSPRGGGGGGGGLGRGRAKGGEFDIIEKNYQNPHPRACLKQPSGFVFPVRTFAASLSISRSLTG